MPYPDWAPQRLVDFHLARLEFKMESSNEDDLRFRSMLPDAMEQEERQEVDKNIDSSPAISPRDSSTLLEVLLTDLRMKNAWKSIARRIEDENEFLHFWFACRDAIWSWQAHQKLSRTERKKFFARIHSLVVELGQMMSETNEYRVVPITQLIDLNKIEAMIEDLSIPPPMPEENATSNSKIVRHCVADVFPHFKEILNHIALSAARYSEEEPLVKKPKSEPAPIQYFIRYLSKYVQWRYGQPLHEVVAATAGVVFHKEDIDSNYVRSLL